MLLSTFLVALCYAEVCRCQHADRDYGLCSQVYQMHEYCTGVRPHRQSANQSTTSIRRGKAGPMGPPGVPGVVDYDKIDEKLAEKIAENEARNGAKFARYEAEIERLENDMEAIKTTAKFARYEAQIELLENKMRCAVLRDDCQEVLQHDAIIWNGTGGVFNIYLGSNKFEGYCDLETDGGKWLVFQRRMDGSIDFYRNWTDYVNGFGDVAGEFWLGLETLHQITSRGQHELRVDMEDWKGDKSFAKYSTFRVGDVGSHYQLTIGGYSGTAGNSMMAPGNGNGNGNGMGFTTKDRDNDANEGNCAVSYKGAWWYKNCHLSNLNGKYFRGGPHKSFADGIEWYSWKGHHYSLKFTEMKIRLVA